MRLSILITVAFLACSCRPVSHEDQVKQKYLRYHAEWVEYWRQPERRIQSFLRGYGGIPSYRAIVELGHTAVPYIAQSVRTNEPGAEELAWAIVDIEKWNKDFDEPPAAVRDKVLARLKASK